MLRGQIASLITAWFILPSCVGCGSGEEVTTAPSDHAASGTVPASSVVAPQSTSPPSATKTDVDLSAREQRRDKREDIGFKNGDGEPVYELKFKEDGGAKLVDPTEREIARYTVSATKLKVKLPDDSVVAYIVEKSDGFEIRDETQKIELFDMKRQSDGDWKLKTADDTVLAVVKKRDYGFEIEDGDDVSLSKAKLKAGKSSIRNADDETVLYTKDEIPSLCMAVLSLNEIESLPVRVGLTSAMLLLSNEGN